MIVFKGIKLIHICGSTWHTVDTQCILLFLVLYGIIKTFFWYHCIFFSLLGDNIKAQRGRKISPGQTVGCLLMHNQFPVFF